MWKKFLAVLAMLYAVASFAAVDVNKATAAELDSVKGIGPAISSRIIDERKKGSFKDWQDFIDRVKGVGEKNAANFSEGGLTVNGSSFKATGATKKDEKSAAKEDKKESKAATKEEKTDSKTAVKEEKPSTKATSKEEKASSKATSKEEKPSAKEQKQEAKAAAKEDKKDAKAEKAGAAAKPAASASKTAASAAKK
jgi:competence protein ComEA